MFNLVSHLVEGFSELTLLDVEDGSSYDVARDATGSSKISLLGNVDVGDVLYSKLKSNWLTYLVFAEEREMEDDLQRLGVSSKDEESSHTSVEGFGGLVSSFLQLYHMTQTEVSHQ